MAALFSVEFLLGFWLFFVVYWLIAPLPKLQNVLLLVCGYYFVYLTSAYSLLVLLSWSACVWLMVTLASREKYRSKAVGILVILMLLYFLVFKYCMPVTEWLHGFIEAKNISLPAPVINILLPLGLSFYLFNSVSLVQAVAKKEIIKPGIISVLLYVNFTPTFIAGPVNRATDLFPQILASTRHVIDFKKALCLIALALVKLFLLSTWLNDAFVTPVFSLPGEQSGWDTLIAVYGWAWNIYFNFSGYTNLVTGLAMLLGFSIPKNFNHPYLAESLKVFWRDWHISLSTFIRDYIYFPLGGNRKGFTRAQVNTMVAMTLSGIWHGAGVNFLLWGAIHGIGLVIYNMWARLVKNPLPAVFSRLLTFHYVCFAWIFFRAESFDDAMLFLQNIYHSELSAITASQFWIISSFIMIIIAYPGFVNLRVRGAEIITGMKWYALPLIFIPVLTAAFFFAPSGVPGFIYANF